eukprot:jgi/Mesen1/7907/ME000420S07043
MGPSAALVLLCALFTGSALTASAFQLELNTIRSWVQNIEGSAFKRDSAGGDVCYDLHSYYDGESSSSKKLRKESVACGSISGCSMVAHCHKPSYSQLLKVMNFGSEEAAPQEHAALRARYFKASCSMYSSSATCRAGGDDICRWQPGCAKMSVEDKCKRAFATGCQKEVDVESGRNLCHLADSGASQACIPVDEACRLLEDTKMCGALRDGAGEPLCEASAVGCKLRSLAPLPAAARPLRAEVRRALDEGGKGGEGGGDPGEGEEGGSEGGGKGGGKGGGGEGAPGPEWSYDNGGAPSEAPSSGPPYPNQSPPPSPSGSGSGSGGGKGGGGHHGPGHGHHGAGQGHHGAGKGHHGAGKGHHGVGKGHHGAGKGHHGTGVGHHGAGKGHHGAGVGHHNDKGHHALGVGGHKN